jgi:hypothetical protein
VIVISMGVSMVERLRVVWISGMIKQQSGERITIGVRWLTRPIFAAAERTRQRGERIRSLEEKAGIRIGATRKEHAYNVER